MALITRKPTGEVPPPVVLLEGETGSGRSWTAAELSASDKVGRTYWIELGDETTADQYGAIPGVRYEIVLPGNRAKVWDYAALYRAARDFRDEAARAAEAGEKPPVLVVDQQGAVWDMLSEWADNRARNTRANREKLAENPNAEIDITSNFWNDATARWRKLMSVFLTTRGIVVLLSRGEEVTAFKDGKPVSGKTTWKVAGQKGFASAMPIWVRMTRDGNPKLIKLRAVVNGIQPGVDREQGLPGFTLERLIFERYGWNPQGSSAREIVPMVAGSDAPLSEMASVIELAIESAESTPQLRQAFAKIEPALKDGKITEVESRHLTRLVHDRKPQMPDSQEQAPANGRAAQVAQADDERGSRRNDDADSSAAIAIGATSNTDAAVQIAAAVA
ncbi:hypothetical protein E1211_30510 [Micromonospora sp. 15K316]|uniref:hypothetical protein n=1 Tax=Micromonospora sp. 15K316 TaxID=2530376 RepID=UPI001051D92F|nr:hypothetical protein [Micromonospora sp. 15K316]TDC25940.1 hypothetical protein E1211_30510 [Micromonospora sp. 15K316]